MAVDLAESIQPARKLMHGDDLYTLSTGEYVQFRHGAMGSPEIDLQEQCPEGKSWEVYISVQITETDA